MVMLCRGTTAFLTYTADHVKDGLRGQPTFIRPVFKLEHTISFVLTPPRPMYQIRLQKVIYGNIKSKK